MKKTFFIFVLFFFCFNIYAGKPKLAVMEISSEGDLFSPKELENTVEYLRGKLASSGKYVLIAKERQQKEKTKMMRKESYKQCYDRSCQIPLGQSLAADTILTGKITMLLGRYTLTVELIDLAKEATVQAASFDFNKKEEFLGILDKVVEKIVHSSDKLPEKIAHSSDKSIDKKPTDLDLKILSRWSKNSTHRMDWVDAKAYCDNLNEDGYSDWRMPTISELRTLVKECSATETGGSCGVNDSCLSKSKCRNNNCNGCPSSDGKYSIFNNTGRFWSSSERKEDKRFVWFVNFFNGSVYSATKTGSGHVRCFRD